MATPTRIGQRYQIEAVLGEGAMGLVYRGFDTLSQQPVAIKSMKNATSEDRIARFKREGEALARLNHPNIVKMLAMAVEAGKHFIVMELVSGGDLQQLLQEKGRLPVDQVLTITLELVDALTRAHYLNIIHRDIKPANVLLAEDGTPRLSDFGVALFGEGTAVFSNVGTAGTYAYISPESLTGQTVDERTDIWAFGVMMYEMLAGERPFQGDALTGLLVAIMNEPVPSIQEKRPDIPTDLAELISRMLVKEPDNRIPSIRLVGAQLEAMRKGVSVRSLFAPAVPKTEEPAPTTAAPLPPPFQAPTELPHFVGRTEPLAEATRLLTLGKAPLVALVGMGGAGKSTAATQLAHQLQHRFADGVLWAEAAMSEPVDIMEAWGQAYGFDFSGLADVESRAAAVRSMLAGRDVLIVLDDVVQISRIRPLLPSTDSCAVLLTTRDLDVATALNATAIQLHELAPTESQALLSKILGDARVQAEAAAAAEICTLLDNLPLAVEIVAQRLQSHPRRRLRDMARRLRDTQQRMGLGLQDQAVRTSFTVSWQALDMQQQRLFSLLGVFAGRPFSAAAMAHIADLDLYTTEDLLFALNALSLVKEDAYPYYRQHALLADFATEKLAEPENAYRLLTNYFYTYAQEHAQQYEQLSPEWDNIMAAIATSHRQEQWSRVLAFADLLTPAWKARGRYTQARTAYQFGHEAAQQLGDDPLLAQNLLRWGEACIEQNSYDEAKRLLRDSLTAYQKHQDQHGIASVQFHLARIATEQNEIDEANQLLDSSQQIWEAAGKQTAVARTIFRRANLQYTVRNFEAARQLLEQALHLQEMNQDVQGMIPTLRLLAQIKIEYQSAEDIKNYAERAYKLSEELEDQGELAATLFTLTVVYRRLGEIDTAFRHAVKGMKLLKRMGLQRFEAFLLFEISILNELKGAFQEAIKTGRESMHILEAIGDNHVLNLVKMHLGDVYLQMEQNDMAAQLWREVADYASATSHANLLTEVADKLSSLPGDG